jgi:transposase
MRTGIEIEVAAEDRARLEAIVADRNRPQKQRERARIVLLSADGVGTLAIMRQVGCAKATVWRWQERFMEEGVDGLLRDRSRPPGKTPLPMAVVEQVVALTLGEPPGEATRWTGRAMAAASGLSVSSVQRIRSVPSSSRAIPSSRPRSRTSSGCTSIRRRTPWCCRSTRKAMCGWPPARKGKADVRTDGLLAVMCPASHEGLLVK